MNTKSGRNRYAGSWRETGWREIALPFNAANLAALLEQAAGLRPTDFTHQDIAHWCDRYTMTVRMGGVGPSPVPTTDGAAMIAEDVSAQWDLFLANTFSLPQLTFLDFPSVQLPLEWFHDWLRRTHELQSTGNPKG